MDHLICIYLYEKLIYAHENSHMHIGQEKLLIHVWTISLGQYVYGQKYAYDTKQEY